MIVPLAIALATPPADAPTAAGGAPGAAPGQTYKQARPRPSPVYILLVLGFFTCGLQLGFVTLHLPAYLMDRGLSAQVGGWTLGIIGLFNIVGAMLSGWLGGFRRNAHILSFIYFARALAVIFLITLPASPAVTLIYGALTGLLWLSSVPPTSGPVVVMFGTRWLAMLFGVAFFSHQVGGFLGIWLGGLVFKHTGSYDAVWWLGVLFESSPPSSTCRSSRSRCRGWPRRGREAPAAGAAAMEFLGRRGFPVTPPAGPRNTGSARSSRARGCAGPRKNTGKRAPCRSHRIPPARSMCGL